MRDRKRGGGETKEKEKKKWERKRRAAMFAYPAASCQYGGFNSHVSWCTSVTPFRGHC